MSPVSAISVGGVRGDQSNVNLLIEVLERQLAPSRPADEVPAPTVQQLMVFIDQIQNEVLNHYLDIMEELRAVLQQRGEQYGEEVLVVMGEEGIAHFNKVKVHRLLGSMYEGNTESERHDGWIDVAGYSVLALALKKWRDSCSGQPS